MKSPTKPAQPNQYGYKQGERSPYKQYIYVPKRRNSGAPNASYPEEKRRSYPPIAAHHQQHGVPEQQRNHRNSFPLPMVYPPKFIYPMQFPPPVSPPRGPHPHGVNRSPPHTNNGRPQHPSHHPPHPHFHPDLHRARASSQPSPLHNVPQYPMVQPRRKSLTPTGPLGVPPGGSPKGMWGPPPPHHIAKIGNVSMRPVAPFFYPGPPPPGVSLYFRPPPHGCFLQPAQPSAPPNSGETLTFVPRPFPVEETSPLKRNKTKVYNIGDLTLGELKEEFRAYAILNIKIKDDNDDPYAVINFAKVKELYRAFQVKHEQEIVVKRKDADGKPTDVTFCLKLEIVEQSLDPMFQLKQEEIESFPLIQFQGKTFVIETPEQIEGAVYALLKRDPTAIEIRDNVILGMDLEWRPVFNVGKYNRTALLQLATGTVCVLFRINILRQEHDVDHPGEQYKLPRLLTQILENPYIRKVGCGLIGDCTRLKNDFGIECAGVDDIAELPIIKRCRPKSLQALTAIFLGGHMSKKQRVSDWERLPHLTRDQIIYAATDAWCGREVYIKMSQMPYSLVYS